MQNDSSEWKLTVQGNSSPPRRLMEEALQELLLQRGEPGLVTIELTSACSLPSSQGSTGDQEWHSRVAELGAPGPAFDSPQEDPWKNGEVP